MKILVTGGAGFIGSHVCEALLKRGDNVICIDNMNDYYDIKQKEANLEILQEYENFNFECARVQNGYHMELIFEKYKPDKIIHLAARAGVRPSIDEPDRYVDTNVVGTSVLLELASRIKTKNFVYASSSSVYGGRTNTPFKETDNVDKPISPYAATKKACEVLCYTYHHLYKMNISCLRFFTVYGSRGRPDMAPYIFTQKIMRGEKINKYGDGTSKRDYTHVSDIVKGIVSALDKNYPYEIFNLGNSKPITLNKFIKVIETIVGRKAKIKKMGMQKGDVMVTCADISKAKKMLDYDPKVSIEKGMKEFYEWYQGYNAYGHNIGSFKLFWYFYLQTKCPRCKTKLVEKGYQKNWQQCYKCLKCGFGDI